MIILKLLNQFWANFANDQYLRIICAHFLKYWSSSSCSEQYCRKNNVGKLVFIAIHKDMLMWLNVQEIEKLCARNIINGSMSKINPFFVCSIKWQKSFNISLCFLLQRTFNSHCVWIYFILSLTYICLL